MILQVLCCLVLQFLVGKILYSVPLVRGGGSTPSACLYISVNVRLITKLQCFNEEKAFVLFLYAILHLVLWEVYHDCCFPTRILLVAS